MTAAPASRLFGVGISGPVLTESERRILLAHPPRAVILFRRNIESVAGVRALTAELAALPRSPLLAVDEEGGPVDRFRDLFGRTASFEDASRSRRAREAGELAGAACRALGFQIDLAPVVDRRLPGASERFLAGRCASSQPEEIVDAASQFLAGLHAAGVSGCVKHFPGLGRAALDTHKALPYIADEPEEESRDLAPFAATMDLAGAVMISHAAGPDGVPASLSPARATDLLRSAMGFSGPAFSDDLEMGALSAFGELPERSARAARAGCDLLFVCSRIEDFPACVAAVEEGVAPARRGEAARRLDAYEEAAVRRAAAAKRGAPIDLARLESEIARFREETHQTLA